MVEIIKDAKVIRRSRNLRGLLDYPRHFSRYVRRVSIEPHSNGGRLSVFYADGAFASADFASFSVLQGWLRSRRSWHGAELFVGTTPCGLLGKDNPRV